MRILITGITGFAGSHLAEALLSSTDCQLFGTSRAGQWPEDWERPPREVGLRACDLGDQAAVSALVAEVRPEQVYHLAGYANTGQSFREPDAAWAGNLTATRCLYDAIHTWGGKPRILFVGSGLVYGDPESPNQAHDERTSLMPSSPYASSKAAADLLSYQYTKFPGLDIVRARPFNHIGPRQSPEFAVAHFAKQVAAIEHGTQPPVLETGDLSPRRDLTDVRDMIHAYRLLMEQGETGAVYNIGSGATHSMQEVVDHLLALARVKIEVRQQAALVRAAETKVVRADASRLRAATGWQPRYTFAQTLSDILEYWRGKS